MMQIPEHQPDAMGAQPSYRKDALMSQLGGPPSMAMPEVRGMERGPMRGPTQAPQLQAPRQSLQNLSAAYQGLGSTPQAQPTGQPMPPPMMSGGAPGPAMLTPDILQLLMAGGR